MRNVFEYAKYFIKRKADTKPDTFDGNMKLQKLLVLSDFAYYVENGEFLFDEMVHAFKNGCVVEKVRLRYKNDYQGLKNDSERFQPEFNEKEYSIIRFVLDVFGNASAKELSDINHVFRFWKEAYDKGRREDGFHDKEMSVVDMTKHEEDTKRMREILLAYKDSCKEPMSNEVINGVTFFYKGFFLTDELIEQLENYSLSAEDESYTVYMEEEGLVIL